MHQPAWECVPGEGCVTGHDTMRLQTPRPPRPTVGARFSITNAATGHGRLALITPAGEVEIDTTAYDALAWLMAVHQVRRARCSWTRGICRTDMSVNRAAGKDEAAQRAAGAPEGDTHTQVPLAPVV
jgi:hypothetical protein